MPWGIFGVYQLHIKKNPRTYVVIAIVFFIGILVGMLSVNGLYGQSKEALVDYVKSFMKIYNIQKVDNFALLKVSLFREWKTLVLIMVLGVSIIGAPLIFGMILVRGFVTGFTLAILVESLGKYSIVPILAILSLKEIFLIPIFLAGCANGIIFSTEMIQIFSGKHFKFENIKQKLLVYCIFTGVQFVAMIFPALLEAVLMPVFIKI